MVDTMVSFKQSYEFVKDLELNMSQVQDRRQDTRERYKPLIRLV
uniref:Uncharacterized protein n=1 Tax=Arundo donax TaxID=35708 RepID=A0A0A8XWJ4_ARUDO